MTLHPQMYRVVKSHACSSCDSRDSSSGVLSDQKKRKEKTGLPYRALWLREWPGVFTIPNPQIALDSLDRFDGCDEEVMESPRIKDDIIQRAEE